MLKIIIIILILMPIVGASKGFQVGSENIEIPDPEKHVQVTQAMPTLTKAQHELSKIMKTRTLAMYIPEGYIPLALAGSSAPPETWLIVSTSPKIEDVVVSEIDFKKTMEAFIKRNDEISEIATRENLALVNKLRSSPPSEAWELVDLFSVDTIPLKFHYKDKTQAAKSFYSKYVFGLGETSKQTIVCTTLTYVFCNGKIIMLYTSAPHDRIEWSREASRKWANKIIEENS